MSDGSLPSKCPSCGDGLLVVRLQCVSCGTEVKGEFDMCPVCTLDEEQGKLLKLFLDSRGNLKAVQRSLGVSYPTVRLRVEELFRTLKGDPPSVAPGTVLEKLRSGEIDVDTAEKLLSGEE